MHRVMTNNFCFVFSDTIYINLSSHLKIAIKINEAKNGHYVLSLGINLTNIRTEDIEFDFRTKFDQLQTVPGHVRTVGRRKIWTSQGLSVSIGTLPESLLQPDGSV